ncbi:bifunctional phosphoribosylaminoimidazolecarboxamide formyltransferase/IMP cyclohydrolase [Melghirimyces algeriensis]|uniref:Bifunctional purine biosynthesis protein PurH n=1 Tax=Melghirimyces algeriensis TaxID=910412 RepID=A0A521DSR7_9BACL|nr:bifunctional phosphoribosylaminoimidazolecarboxamide formyltransferase/IMP cyclohydrolase [Melghirimyces algeriensis]SMO74658.1 IMP cyclohydrolase [Melghirimyces algeriensis]
MKPIRRALISVSDKTGVVDLAQRLSQLGVEIVSTGGTRKKLLEEGLPVIGVSEVTGFPEILDGRVKTLHPRIHGGLLAVRDREDHIRQLKERNIDCFDLVVVNLYPFQQTIAKPDVSFQEAIENIDIGGPSMVRAAAKNHQYLTVLVDPNDYAHVLDEAARGGVCQETRERLAAKAFRHTAAYDAVVAEYLTEKTGDTCPEKWTVTYEKQQELRYGENPHQDAAFYRDPVSRPGSLVAAEQLHGKELSYNNINDADAALGMILEFEQPAVVAVKHMNPCGVGMGHTLSEAFQKAYESDPVSIFGGIVALNRTVDVKTAKQMKEIFLEIILAPDFEPEAIQLLTEKKNLRLLKLGQLPEERTARLRLQSVRGGALVQSEDQKSIEREACTVPTDRQPTEEEWEQLLFAWKVVKHVKSNAIVLAKGLQTIGIGAGQMNRVGAARIAIEQAGEKVKGSVLASDAFFPKQDTVEAAAKAGVKAIIQPGGSIRDQESIEAANRFGIAMVFTHTRHFKH